MALNNTTWPSEFPPPEKVKSWLAALYATADSKAPDSGQKLADLYTDDAVVHGLHGRSVGSQAICESRKTAWNLIESRSHEVIRVYTIDSTYSDILLVGKLTAAFKTGAIVTSEFTARVAFPPETSGGLKAHLYEVWGDSAPWTKAMGKN